MPSPTSAPTAEETTSKQTPFDRIRALEEREETRLRETNVSVEEEARSMQQTIARNEANEEAALRADAEDAIKHFAESEPAALMEKAKTEAQADLARIDASFASNVDEVRNSLVESLLKGVLFPH